MAGFRGAYLQAPDAPLPALAPGRHLQCPGQDPQQPADFKDPVHNSRSALQDSGQPGGRPGGDIAKDPVPGQSPAP